MENNKTEFNGVFEIDKTYENDNWIRTKIRTFAFGKNRNGSDILNSSFSDFNNAKTTIGGIPVVAKYNEEKDNLEGHNAILRTNKDGELEIFHDTNALGFTSPTSTFYLEEVNEGNEISPDYKTYVVVEDVYLWKRFDATKKILEWANNNIPAKVSMEIDNVKGQFDKDGYFQIQDFNFTGICALGSDVEPCFPMAEIQMYSLNDFKKDLKDLLFELTNQSKESDVKGGNTEMENVETQVETEVIEEVETTVEETQAEENFEQVTEVEAEVTEEAVVETEETVEQADVVEATEEVVEEVVEDIDTTDYKLAYENLNALFEDVKVELEELKQFKRNALETELASKFENQLSDEELKAVFEQSKNSTLEDIEKELFALVGKKNFSMKQQEQTKSKVVLSTKEEKPKTNNPYGDFFNI